MKKIFYLFIMCFLFSQNAMANYLENIKKCDFNKENCFFYERKDSGIIDMMVILKHSGESYEDKNGLNTFALSMMNMGSSRYTYRDFQNKLKDLSTTFNVYSDQDNSYIYIKSLKENFSTSLDLIFEALFQTNFSNENFQLAQNVMISRVRAGAQDYEYLANQSFLKELFKGQIYEAKILSEDDVLSISEEDIKNYINYKLMNATPHIVISGDLAQKDIEENLKKHLAHFGKDDSPNKKIPEPVKLNLFSKPVEIKDGVEKAQTIIHFAQKMPNLLDKDFIVMTLLNDYIGGGGLNSKLMKKLREEMNITYSAKTIIVNLEKANYITGGVATGSNDIQKILDEINNIFKNVSDNGLTEDELNYLKTKFYGKQAMNFSDNRKALYDLALLVKNNLPFDFYQKNKEIVEKLTTQDIKNVAKKFLDDKNLSFVIYN